VRFSTANRVPTVNNTLVYLQNSAGSGNFDVDSVYKDTSDSSNDNIYFAIVNTLLVEVSSSLQFVKILDNNYQVYSSAQNIFLGADYS
jgi:hypothetical protein